MKFVEINKIGVSSYTQEAFMARPKKVRPVTSAEVLEFIEGATLEILEIVSRVIERKIAQLKVTK
jgi:hypothetical protein